MAKLNRNLLVMFNTGFMDELAVKKEQSRLVFLLDSIHDISFFIIANELLDRNRIHSNPKKMIANAKQLRLRPFRFFINKN